VASYLLLSDIPIRALNELAQRNTVWRIVAGGHGRKQHNTFIPAVNLLDYFFMAPPDLSM